MAEGAKLVLTRRLAATPRDVFEALTTTNLLAQWFSPRPFDVCEVEADLRLGGKFSFRMTGEPGTFGAEGVYKEIVPDRRLALTWTWVEKPSAEPLGAGTSLVTFDLAPDGHGTLLTLTHEQLPGQEQVNSHKEGWTEALAKLARLLDSQRGDRLPDQFDSKSNLLSRDGYWDNGGATRMTAQRPSAEMAAAGSKPFPNESAEYREARTALLAEEIELRRHIARVAEMRRALPPGGVARDYRFLDAEGKELGLADLFGRHDTLFTYFWMYGPERERPCPMCTSFVGSLDIPTPDIEQRLAIAIVGRSPVARQLAFARERGWSHLQFYQTIGDDFAKDYRALVEGEEGAAVLMWRREGDQVRLFWAAEGDPETADPGQDAHLAPDPTPLWTLLDWTPGGRGTSWYPKLEYDG